MHVDTLILGAGLSGLSASFHIGHAKCLILEAKPHLYGHIHSEFVNGFTWDEGPHVSFTNSEYVRELFAESVDGQYEEYEVKTGNYFRGHWIAPPAQSNLYQVPEPLRSQCLKSFLESRTWAEAAPPPANYQEWLHQAFGPVFADTFPAAYTRKYWTRDPKDLRTEWVGQRVFKPTVEDVVAGSQGPLNRQTHYIKKVCYPRQGGYQSFARKLTLGANVKLGTQVVQINLVKKQVTDAQGCTYNHLITTIPLPSFVKACTEVPASVVQAADRLRCSSLLLVNIMAPHPTLRPENWLYVYDEDMYSTRINCTEKLSCNNAPPDHTGIQVEVYHSPESPLKSTPEAITKAVIEECKKMGLLALALSWTQAFHRSTPWANVIFTHDTPDNLESIWQFFERHGYERDPQDTLPLTDWSSTTKLMKSDLIFCGRFAQWKYFWTDDCVLSGQHFSRAVASDLLHTFICKT